MVMVMVGQKTCTACGRMLPVAEYHPNGGGRPGYHAECKSCFNARNRAAYARSDKAGKMARDAAWRASNPEAVAAITRRSNLRRKYGITPEQYDAMLQQQGGCCAVCRAVDSGDRRFETFAVDHDHATGAIRGLLCAHCNRALGHVGDDVDRLMALAAYLLQHSNVLGEVSA